MAMNLGERFATLRIPRSALLLREDSVLGAGFRVQEAHVIRIPFFGRFLQSSYKPVFCAFNKELIEYRRFEINSFKSLQIAVWFLSHRQRSKAALVLLLCTLSGTAYTTVVGLNDLWCTHPVDEHHHLRDLSWTMSLHPVFLGELTQKSTSKYRTLPSRASEGLGPSRQ